MALGSDWRNPVWTLQLLFLLLVSCHYATANCGDPTVPTNGSIYGTYQNATEGTEIVFRCNAGFFPTENITAVCQADGRWNPATVMCTLPLQSWHIGLLVVGVLAWLVTIAVILTGMLVACGFHACCWTVFITILFVTIVGIPIAIALLVYGCKKAERNKECSNSGTCSSKTCSSDATGSKARRVGYYWGFYQGLTTVVYVLILNGLAWWIVFAVAASTPPNDNSRRRITRDVLVAFCLSVAALVLAIVAVIFIIPYRKCRSECKGDYGQMGVSHKVATGDNPEEVKIKDADDF